jgi:hypothetical protein
MAFDTKLRVALYASLLAWLTGCVNPEPAIERTAKADPSAGYVAAAFGRYDNDNDGFALTVKRQGSDKEFIMPIDPDAKHRKSHATQVLVMKLPPGNYEVTGWVTYVMGREQTRGTVQSADLSKPFVIEAGRVSFLGSFDLLKQYLSLSPVMTVRWAIETSAIQEAQARDGLATDYPGLAGLHIDCLACSK